LQAHFWARSGNWLFSDWRDLDFSRLRDDDGETLPGGVDRADAGTDGPATDAFTRQSVEALKLAMTQEGVLPVDDIARIMAAFYRRMDPRRPAKACGACGVMDVPLDAATSAAVGRAEAARIGVTRFVDVPLGDPLLGLLAYTPEEAAAYDIAVPPHIPDTPANREHWARYKLVKSSILIPPAGGEATTPGDQLPVRMHLYPALCVGAAGGTDAQPFSHGLQPHSTRLCGPCHQALTGASRPEPSVAAGWDLGDPRAAGLPELSWAESMAVARTRVLSTALNLRVQRNAGGWYLWGPSRVSVAAPRSPPTPLSQGRSTV
jgi:hypothetical protein